MTGSGLDEGRLQREVRAWRSWQRRRLEALIGYATGRDCRRRLIAAHFGDEAKSCGPGSELCDHCDPAPAPWDLLPDRVIPDPEALVDVELAVLQAVAWASGYTGGRYNERNLSAALLGKEFLGEGRPLGAGLLSCPQFGALRWLRGAETRLRTSIENLIGRGLVGREQAADRDGRPYSTLVLTEDGRRVMGIPRG